VNRSGTVSAIAASGYIAGLSPVLRGHAISAMGWRLW
jgi:hypothetical protein